MKFRERKVENLNSISNDSSLATMYLRIRKILVLINKRYGPERVYSSVGINMSVWL